MLPNEILSVRFSKAGKDGYKMSEVDSFKDKVYKYYNKLYTDNNILSGRVSELNSLIQKYNSDKEAIASTLIYAQSTSDKTLSEARKKADEIVKEANDRAESEYAERIRLAEEKLQNLHSEYERTKAELERYSASYTENINAQAKELIERANAMAAKIVAEAKTEAQKVAEENDVAVREAKKELRNIGNTISKFKAETAEIASRICTLTEGVSDKFDSAAGKFDFSDLEVEEILTDTIEPFTMPDFSEILAQLDSVDISSGRTIDENSISGIAQAKAEEVNDYITKIFEAVGSDGAEFSSFKEGLAEAFSKDVTSKGDISFARDEDADDSEAQE